MFSNDNYGKDIKIENGDIAILNGDFATVGSTDNLNQAIQNRLQTALDSRIRLNAYGIAASIGNTTEIESYLLTSIYNTVMQDPRIKSIESLSYVGNGDQLEIDLKYIDINNRVRSYGGTI